MLGKNGCSVMEIMETENHPISEVVFLNRENCPSGPGEGYRWATGTVPLARCPPGSVSVYLARVYAIAAIPNRRIPIA